MNIHVNKPAPSGRVTTVIEIGHADLQPTGSPRPFDDVVRGVASQLHSTCTDEQFNVGATTTGILPRPLTVEAIAMAEVEVLISSVMTGVTGFLTLRGEAETVVLVATVVFNEQ